MAAQGFLAFDVETPDAASSRICQIGCVEQTVTATQIAVRDYGYLVNPECDFFWRNVQVHGITEDDVAQEPTFDHIWKDNLAESFRSHILVAHNARFDMKVLSKTLTSYGIEQPQLSYIDTLEVACRCYPELPNHKLDTVSDYLDVPLTHHHDASSDAYACYGILMESMRRFGAGVVRPRTFTLPVAAGRSGDFRVTAAERRRAEKFAEFSAVVRGIIADGRIELSEAMVLFEWMHSDNLPSGVTRQLGPMLSTMLLDGTIDAAESESLISQLRTLQDPAAHDVSVIVNSHAFVLTGDFACGSKIALARQIAERGGEVKSGVSGKVDYVVRGSLGSPQWNHGTYGTKVEKALELQRKGSEIQIVDEDALSAALGCS